MITRLSIAFEDLLASSITPQVMPPWAMVYQDWQIWGMVLREGQATKSDEFRKNSKGGRGGISNPKIYIAYFGPLQWAFFGRFPKNCNIIFRKWGGGGRRPFGSVTRPLWPQQPSSPPQQGCSAPSPAAEGDGRWGRGGQGGQGQGRDSFCWWWWPSSWAQWPWWAWWLCWPWWQRDQGQGGLMLYRITRFKIMDCLMKDFFSMSNPLCS